MKTPMKKAIQSILNHAGYRIAKIRQPLGGEQIFLLDFALFVLNQRCKGVVRFMQVGANDGIQEDPCYAWINRFPWQGVLVEPQPKVAAQLRAMYIDQPRIAIEQVVVADQPGELELHYLKAGEGVPEWATGIASLDYASIAAHREKILGFDAAIARIKVPALTIEQLLMKNGFETVDFLQIDAEGYDAKILASIDFRRIPPQVISYEDCNLTHEERADCRSLLSREGYKFATWHGDTLACLPEVLPVSSNRKVYFDLAASSLPNSAN